MRGIEGMTCAMLAIASVDAFALTNRCPGATRGTPRVVNIEARSKSGPAGDKVSRRELFDVKGFYAAGGGEALLFVIAGSIAAYGGSRRKGFYEQIAALDAGGRNIGGSADQYLPTLSLAKPKSRTLGGIEVRMTWPATNGDYAEFAWLKDANTGIVLAAKAFREQDTGPKEVFTIVERGQRVVPVLKYSSHGLWEGDAMSANA